MYIVTRLIAARMNKMYRKKDKKNYAHQSSGNYHKKQHQRFIKKERCPIKNKHIIYDHFQLYLLPKGGGGGRGGGNALMHFLIKVTAPSDCRIPSTLQTATGCCPFVMPQTVKSQPVIVPLPIQHPKDSYFVIASGWADLSYCNFHRNDINLATDQFGSNNCQRLIPGRDLFVVFDGTWKEAKTKSGSWFSFLSFTFCPWPDWIMRSWQWYNKQRSMKLCNFTWENKTL